MLARVAAVTACAAVVVVVGGTNASATTSAIDHVTPANTLPGHVIDIVGTGLTGATGVTFAGVTGAVTPSNVTDTDVTVAVPAGAQSGSLTLNTPSGDLTAPLGIEAGSISRSASAVLYPHTAVISATLSAAGQGIAGEPSTLLVRTVGTTRWSRGATINTDSTGAAKFLVKPTRTTQYAVNFVASAKAATLQTATTSVGLRPVVNAALPVVAPILTTQRFTGVVRPGVAGTVQLQRLISGVWHTVGTVSADSAGRFAFVVKPWSTKGTYTYRVVRPADATHLRFTTSAHAIRAVDRTLRSGMTGPDVSYLQTRLRALHYDVPAVTGGFNYDTLHAVIAFQKVQRLTRTGEVTPNVWLRLGRPVLPHLLHPLSGVSAVEVDLTKQVLYYAVNGVIQRILDVSTGGGYTYTGSDGRPSVAITPTGHFHVVYKINKWVTSKLGTLYRPAYFNNAGYAIHGEGAVPSFPASHGCVRITVPAMDRLYAKLLPGMSVWIYKS
jgi:N-acetylmuramoyl-L-alanine amidase